MYFDNVLEPENDRGRIILFLKSMSKFLDTLSRSPGEVIPSLRYRAPELREAVQNAWREEVPRSIILLIEGVQRTSMSGIARRGLTGASLEAKLTTIKWWDAQIPELGKKALVYLLKCINSFLGSLPLGLADAVKEAKEMLEHTLDLD